MTINLKMPDITELKPRIHVFGVGGAGGNAVNNMISSGLEGVDFVVANTDSQALKTSRAERVIQMGIAVTEGLGAGSHPEVGEAAAEEVLDEIKDHLENCHMAFVTAGMGGGTGTGAAPVIARTARDMGILTVGVVTKPFLFEGPRRMRTAEAGIDELEKHVDTLIVIPNQNLFRIANEKTTFSEAFSKADQVLYSGVACITDLMVKEGLINLDFADVRAVMRGMGRAMMGTGEASGDNRALQAAEAAIANPLLDETSMQGAKGLLISITGGDDLTLYEVDSAATRIRDEVDPDANIILGATFDEALEGVVRVSVVATGVAPEGHEAQLPQPATIAAPAVAEAAAAAPANVDGHGQPALEGAELDQLSRELHDAAQATAATQQAETPEPAAPVQHDGVTLERRTPQTATPAMPQMRAGDVAADQGAADVPAADDSFVPEPAVQPDARGPSMPRIEEFPAPAQAEYRAHQEADEEPEDKRRPSLFERLARGLARPDQDDHDAFEEAPAEPQLPVAERPRPAVGRERPAVSEFAKPERPAQHESQVTHAPRRQVAGAPQPQIDAEEDQYEIPAFLRRQSS